MSVSKIVAAAASGVGGAGLDVDEVFSTHLYTGDGSNGTAIVNGIDLAGEGGLVWRKKRSGDGSINDNVLVDTERGKTKFILSNSTAAEATSSNSITSFNNNGFTIVDNNSYGMNLSNETYVSWTFRKTPKFCDVITYSGNSTAGRTISHNLGCTVGQVFVKRTSHTNNWICWHRGIANNKYLQLNSTSQAYSDGGIFWNNTTPSSTTVTLGADSGVNATGSTYVMYVFAHNNNDGEFGPDSDQDIIKCGTYTGNGSTTGPVVDLGFEPQWLLLKRADGSGSWFLLDVMRGIPTASTAAMGDGKDALQYADGAYTDEVGYQVVDVNPNGFQLKYGGSNLNGSNGSFLYMAIRRGSLNIPEDATKVFAISTNGQAGDSTAPAYRSTFPVDMYFEKSTGGSPGYISSRLTGSKYMQTNATNAEASDTNLKYDFMNGVYNSNGSNSAYYGYMWRRAPGYFDVVCYDGNGATSQNVSHNLGVVPEMMWVKRRTVNANASSAWQVYHKDLTNDSYYLILNEAAAQNTNSDRWNSTAPTASVFTVGISDAVNKNTGAPYFTATPYIAFLFATAPGVSKVGSFTGAGSDVTVDCGFSNGAKFVIIKDTNATDDWYVYDTARGIVAGNDGYLELNTTNGENTGADYIDPHSSGFIITSGFMQSGRTYIFYAIA